MKRKNIILIGMPGVGKTTVGKALGEKMGRTCVDVDQELEKEIGDISNIYYGTRGTGIP